MLDSSPNFRFIELNETTSTNSYLATYRPQTPCAITLVTAEYQTAGRGQTGNGWESAAGQNLLFSLLLYPTLLPASDLFLLSEAIALSIREAVEACLRRPQTFGCRAADGCGSKADGTDNSLPPVTVKWPNDVYVGDRKIAGILIENELRGLHTGRCIVGCGINVNQQVFRSDAPNPVSLQQLLGCEVERSLLLDAVITAFRRRYAALEAGSTAAWPLADMPREAQTALAAPAATVLHRDYLAALYRRSGRHLFREAQATEPFQAEIVDVETGGHLILQDTNGHRHRYAFKEVAFVL